MNSKTRIVRNEKKLVTTTYNQYGAALISNVTYDESGAIESVELFHNTNFVRTQDGSYTRSVKGSNLDRAENIRLLWIDQDNGTFYYEDPRVSQLFALPTEKCCNISRVCIAKYTRGVIIDGWEFGTRCVKCYDNHGAFCRIS